MRQNRKKREKQLFKSLSNIAEKQNCKITQYECCIELAIGLDKTANYLFFFNRFKDKEIAKYVNLAEIQNCKLVNTTRNINNKYGNYKVIDKLELKFSPIDKNKPYVFFEFYNAEEGLQLTEERNLIEKWEKIITERLVS
ncbi:MAG: hypothetical protein A2X02_02780 [Bacteroidetes bacterium GWF2_29_10]|nr:MAG: hypothetical protein A2X02_02780 [Bacteroidetes bacterium GWF2_29_10]